MDDRQATALQRALGHAFADENLLRRALTHRSRTSEAEDETSNERLEFLGDAVLDLVVADELYRRFDLQEGAMAKARAEVVDEPSLAEVAIELGLGECLVLGKGEETSGGRGKPSILSDAMEAVLGAMYLDGGYTAARRLILERLGPRLDARAAEPGETDFKTRLQELLAADGLFPEYEVAGEGPDHQRRFTAVVEAGGAVLGTGQGTSKKRAQQDAARAALAALDA